MSNSDDRNSRTDTLDTSECGEGASRIAQTGTKIIRELPHPTSSCTGPGSRAGRTAWHCCRRPTLPGNEIMAAIEPWNRVVPRCV